ncbi:MAG: hypothetical protein KC503_22250 [Myxococcales bacterium]|nr:hypothetical protein [Myxococcales bacterium]
MGLSRHAVVLLAALLSLLSSACFRVGFDDKPLGARDASADGSADASETLPPDAPGDVTQDAIPPRDAPPLPVEVSAPDIAPRDTSVDAFVDAPPILSDSAVDVSVDTSCAVAVAQTASNRGYLSLYTTRAYAQAFTPSVSGRLGKIEVYEQTLNGGQAQTLRLAVLNATPNGVPSGAPLAEESIGPLQPGWLKYVVDFSRYNVQLNSASTYALRFVSESVQSTRHTVAFGTRSGTGVGPLYASDTNSTSGWSLATSVVTTLVSTDAIYFQVLLCP